MEEQPCWNTNNKNHRKSKRERERKMLAFAIHKPHVNLNKKLAFLSSCHNYMGSKFLLKPTTSTIPTPLPLLPSSNKQQYRTFKRLSPVFCSSKPTSKFNRSLLTQTNGLPFSPLPAPGIYLMFFRVFWDGFLFLLRGVLGFCWIRLKVLFCFF